VTAMMRGPPERTLLRRCETQEREHELERATRLERAMREVAVIAGRDGEHADRVAADEPQKGRPAPADPDGADQRRGVDTPERQVFAPARAIRPIPRELHRLHVPLGCG